jgi:hypothetical protein
MLKMKTYLKGPFLGVHFFCCFCFCAENQTQTQTQTDSGLPCTGHVSCTPSLIFVETDLHGSAIGEGEIKLKEK